MSFDSATIAALRARLTKEKQSATEIITVGRCEDLRQYGYSCGYIKALDDVFTFIDEITSDLQKG